MRKHEPRLAIFLLLPSLLLWANCPAADNEIGKVLDDGGAGGENYRWTEVPGPTLPPRMDGIALTYKQRLWVMGGDGVQGDYLNDVWSTADGQTWTQATASAGWTGRTMLAGAVFRDRMWVIDGDRLSDVWSSTDGATWTKTATSTSFPPRYGHGVLVYADKLWVIGGYGAGGTQIADVWSSPDGATWTQATAAAPWGNRDGFVSAVFDGRMWILGGYVENFGVTNDAWSSTDGVTWKMEATPSFAARDRAGGTVFGGKLWYMGGGDQNDVWSTSDGKTWTQMPAGDVPWSPRAGFSIGILGDSLFLIGPRTGDIWKLSPAP